MSWALLKWVSAIIIVLVSSQSAKAESPVSASTSSNLISISVFLLFLVFTLGITAWAAKRTKSREAFYAASGGITPWQNALAIAGDFMSAATFLGITGLMFFVGIDGFIMSFTIIIGWSIMLMVIAERFRNLGKFTVVDVISYRLKGQAIRILMVVCSLSVILFYLIGQMVGAGKLIELLFGIDYLYAVIGISALMVIYVTFGGMLATTWVQMIKALLLILGGAIISFLLLARFGFDLSSMFKSSIEVHPKGQAIMESGGWLKKDPLNVLSVGLTMTFGIMGLPHILMRFFTVKDAASARKSVAYATIFMSVFYIFILIIGIGAIAILWGNPEFYDASGTIIGGSNMVALHASRELGGDLLYGFVAAVAFATILAVVAGLTLAGAAAIAHDLYAGILKKGKSDPKTELKLSKAIVVLIGLISVLTSMAFEAQNIAVVTTFALALAASVNFPLLILSMYWRGLTSKGAVTGGLVTLIFTLIMIVCSQNIWVDVLGNESAISSLIYPTLFTMPFGFILIIGFSLLDRSHNGLLERESFKAQFIRSETGIGAATASQH